MKSNTRRRHQSNFKAKIAIEAIKEQKTMSQISSEHQLHANQITEWKKVLLERSHELFEKTTTKKTDDNEQLQSALYQQIGEMKVELDFLKKKLKQLCS